MRDRESDQKAGKNTIVVSMGGDRAKKYHQFLLVTAMLCMVLYTSLSNPDLSHWIYVVSFAPVIKHLRFVQENKELVLLDPELKKLALGTFFMCVLFSLGL